MALKITATTVVKRKVIAGQHLDPTNLDFIAERVRATLVQVIPAEFTADVIVTVQNVNKLGEPKNDEVGLDAGQYGF
jgi:hypothetical protein